MALQSRATNQSAAPLALYSSLIDGDFTGDLNLDPAEQKLVRVMRAAFDLFSETSKIENPHKRSQNPLPKSFVVVEGIDGVGKSTLLEALTLRLSKRGIKSVSFQELPDDQLWQNQKDFLFRNPNISLEDRVNFSHLTRIRRLDKIWADSAASDVLLLDRYYYTWLSYLHVGTLRTLSTLAARRKIMNRAIKNLCFSLYSRQLPRPNLTLYLACSPEVSISRINARGDTIRHARPREYFGELAKAFQLVTSTAKTVRILNAEQAPDVIARTAESLILRTL